jgi:hypothetical protein
VAIRNGDSQPIHSNRQNPDCLSANPLWEPISGMIQCMRIPSATLNELILTQLADGEMRLLVLIVGIRKRLDGSPVKGDLAARVQTALRGLVAAKSVLDSDGVYSLRPVPTAVISA